MSAFGFAVLSAVLTGGGVFLVVLTVLHEIARWKGRFVSVWLTFFAALLILPVLFGALIVGYAAFTQVDGSETLIPSVFWILIATGVHSAATSESRSVWFGARPSTTGCNPDRLDQTCREAQAKPG